MISSLLKKRTLQIALTLAVALFLSWPKKEIRSVELGESSDLDLGVLPKNEASRKVITLSTASNTVQEKADKVMVIEKALRHIDRESAKEAWQQSGWDSFENFQQAIDLLSLPYRGEDRSTITSRVEAIKLLSLSSHTDEGTCSELIANIYSQIAQAKDANMKKILGLDLYEIKQACF